MIEYIGWAEEYEAEADKLQKRITDLKKYKETEKLSLDDLKDVNERIIRLNSLCREHKLVAKHLRERGNYSG